MKPSARRPARPRLPAAWRLAAAFLALSAPAAALAAGAGPASEPLPKLSIGDVEITERNFGDYGSGKVLATLDRPAPADILFFTSIIAGDTDEFDGIAGENVTIPAGATEVEFYLGVRGDDDFEADESFTIRALAHGGDVLPVRDGQGVILNDDEPPVLALRDDLFTVRENTPAVLDFRSNDMINEYGDRPRIVVEPALGTAVMQDQGTAETFDDRILYTPHPDTSGDDQLSYEFCYSAQHCRRAVVYLRVRPSDWVVGDATWGHGGHVDMALGKLRPLPSARFVTTPFVRPRATASHALESREGFTIDGRDAFLSDPAARGVAPFTIPPPVDGQARTLRIVARLSAGSGIHLYLGEDTNGDGQASRDENRCTSAMSGQWPCEMTLEQAPGQTLRYWTLVHAHEGYGMPVDAAVQVFEVPIRDGDASIVATGPGRVMQGEDFTVRVGWRDPEPTTDMRVGYLQVRSDAGTTIGLVPVGLIRSFYSPGARPLASGREVPLRTEGDDSRSFFIDVPPGATHLTLASRNSTGNVDFELRRQDFWTASNSTIFPDDASATVFASATGPSGDETLVLQAPTLTEGRWYVIARTPSGLPVDYRLRVTLEGTQAPTPPGSYYNPQRPGHGLFLYPAGNVWAGIWYTYLQDGSSTWYWLQGAKPGADGLWNGKIYRAAWNGGSALLTEIGEAFVTPGTADVPAFRFSYIIDGEVGSEPMFRFGVGCPQQAGAKVDISTHWFNPERAGTGYSVQTWPNYEFHAAFVYDALGVPRYLAAEFPAFGGASASTRLLQVRGSCPTCIHGNPAYSDVGVFGRDLLPDGRLRMRMDGVFDGGVPGAWSVDEVVQALGGPGTTQGCP